MAIHKIKPTFSILFSWIVLVILVLIVTPVDFKQYYYKNLSQISLNKAINSDNITAENRQVKLTDFLRYMRLSGDKVLSAAEFKNSDNIGMLRAIFIGSYYRYHGYLDESLYWYKQAIDSDPAPLVQDSLSYLNSKRLVENGSILVDDLSDNEGWQFDNSSNVEELVFENSDGILNISFENIPNRRDKLVFDVSTGLFNLGYHRLLSIRIKLEPGTFFTLSAKIDDELERYVSYYQGSGEWETITVPLHGDVIHYLRINFSETGKPNLSDSYQAQIDWIHLEPFVE